MLLCLFFIVLYILFHPNVSTEIIWKHQKKRNIILNLYITINCVLILYLSHWELLDQIKDTFMRYEMLIYINICILLLYGRLYYVNAAAYLNEYLIIVKFVNLIELVYLSSSTLLIKEYSFIFYYKLFLILILFVWNGILHDIKEYRLKDNLKTTRIEYSDLFKTRYEQSKEITNRILAQNDNEPLTILISDEEGGGKTHFVNNILEKIKENKKIHIIEMDALDICNKELFLSNLLSKIIKELKAKKYFVSIKGLEGYFDNVLKIALENSALAVIQHPIRKYIGVRRGNEFSLDEERQEFSKILGNSRILLVIDHFDKCSKDLSSETIYFLNNILLLPKSVIILVGDKQKLIQKEILTEDTIYSYFSYIYSLKKIPYSALLDSIQSDFQKKLYPIFSFDVKNTILDKVNILKAEVKRLKKFCEIDYAKINTGLFQDKSIKDSEKRYMVMENGINIIENKLSNARSIQKLYQEVYEKLIYLYETNAKQYFPEKLRIHIKKTFIPACIFKELVKILCPSHLDKLGGHCEAVINYRELLIESTNEEEQIYLMLEFSFFQDSIEKNFNTKEEFWNTYNMSDIKEYLQQNKIR